MRALNVILSVIVLCLLLPERTVLALDHVAFERDGGSRQISGRIVLEAQDGGLLVLDRAVMLWAITPEEKTAHAKDDEPYSSCTKEELSEQLLQELPSGFKIHSTVHYLICYNTSPAYAQWCGSLYERLYAAFTNYWEKRG